MIHIQEADAAVSILGEMDAWIICPFFLQGGRYTINDVHYVADSDRYVIVSNMCVYLIFSNFQNQGKVPFRG